MEITFYIEEYLALFNLPLATVIYRLFFWYFGWLPVAIAFLYGISIVWLDHISGKWSVTQKFVLLAVDVPRNNEQTLKAVENMFTYLIGTQSGPNLIETWWEGKYQLGFSFEIVGIDGYIQFVIRTPLVFRNNVETAIYSQYPDAEITEVEDYTNNTPTIFPDPDFDIWGAEFTYTAPEQTSIKCYSKFEHLYIGPAEMQYKDPMALLMDLLSSLRRGEQLWIQHLITPIDNSWTKKSDDFITKLMGDKGDNLPPAKRKLLESAIEKKNKVCFKTKIRTIYFSKKDVMDKAKVVNGYVGYMRQFGENNVNGFMPYKGTATSTAYFRAAPRLNDRKNRIFAAYKSRSSSKGGDPYIMSVEELATLWHFPVDAVVKAPLLQRASVRKIEAPMSIPTLEDSQPASPSSSEPIFDKGYSIESEDDHRTGNKSSTKEVSFSDKLSAEIEESEQTAALTDDLPPNNLPFV